MILVTGGHGFIAANFLLEILKDKKINVLNIDKSFPKKNRDNIKGLKSCKNYKFIKTNIGNKKKISYILKSFQPKYIINFAAETHVDHSINNPSKTIKNNIIDTIRFYDEVYKYWKSLNFKIKKKIKIIQISTDEVYGSLKKNEKPFTETCSTPIC